MKPKVLYRKVSDYIRYDLKEIVLPSSLPDPSHVVKRRKLTWHERFLVLKEASRLYAASWVRDIGPELRPNDYKKQGDAEPKKQAKETEKEPSVLEDLGKPDKCFFNLLSIHFSFSVTAVAARGGMETLRPALHRVYMTRASNYKDALASFIKGYHEGVQQVMQSKEESQFPKNHEADNSKKTT
ncbi:hypothetical protein Bca4012_000285 [Brassica carinata]|uniref:Embryo defective 2735 n=1 Tax=Brassica carinata TaxID=52824 RepID=A0A8X7WSN6_BRACI|nr:hypothetical protein Bca52824_005985 [Brassica carinata]